MDEEALSVLGVDPEEFDGRTETWTHMIHPDDLPLMTAEAERAIRTESLFVSEHRVIRPDGTIAWIQVRAQIKPDETGRPTGLVGTIWDTTESRVARKEISHALRHMSDGFLALDERWRITFVNPAAEEVIGQAQDLTGQVLWEPPAIERLPLMSGLRGLCRQAVTTSTPSDMEIKSPRNHRWYHLRLVPIPDGLAFFFTDIHDKRERETEREAAARAESERAARTTELTEALAKALGSHDVAEAAAHHVLPLLGAAGLIVQAVEGNETRVVGSVGYPRAFLDRIDTLPLTERNAVTDVLRSRTPQFFSSPEEYVRVIPILPTSPPWAGSSRGRSCR